MYGHNRMLRILQVMNNHFAKGENVSLNPFAIVSSWLRSEFSSFFGMPVSHSDARYNYCYPFTASRDGFPGQKLTVARDIHIAAADNNADFFPAEFRFSRHGRRKAKTTGRLCDNFHSLRHKLH